MFGRKADVRRSALKVVDLRKDTLSRLRHLRNVIEGYNDRELKAFFEHYHSTIYLLFHDAFNTTQANLQIRVTKAHREELDFVLFIFEKILLCLPELVHKRWQVNSIGDIMKRLLHHGNSIRLRREGTKLFVMWYGSLMENAPTSAHHAFQSLLWSASSLPLSPALGRVGDEGPLVPPQAGDKTPSNLTKYFLECLLLFIVSESCRVWWSDQTNAPFDFLFRQLRLFYLPQFFQELASPIDLYSSLRQDLTSVQISLTSLSSSSSSTLFTCQESIIRWFYNNTLLPSRNNTNAKSSSEITDNPYSASQKEVEMVRGVLYGCRENINTIHEIFRQAFLQVYGMEPYLSMKRVVLVYKSWFNAYCDAHFPQPTSPSKTCNAIKPSETLFNTLVEDGKKFEDHTKNTTKPFKTYTLTPLVGGVFKFPSFFMEPSHEEEEEEDGSCDDDVEGKKIDKKDCRLGLQKCLNVFFEITSHAFNSYPENNLHIDVCRRVLNLWKFATYSLSMHQQTWEMLLKAMWRAALVMGDDVPSDNLLLQANHHQPDNGELAELFFKTLFSTWMRAHLHTVVSPPLWGEFTQCMTSLVHCPHLLMQWSKTMALLTKIVAKQLYGLESAKRLGISSKDEVKKTKHSRGDGSWLGDEFIAEFAAKLRPDAMKRCSSEHSLHNNKKYTFPGSFTFEADLSGRCKLPDEDLKTDSTIPENIDKTLIANQDIVRQQIQNMSNGTPQFATLCLQEEFLTQNTPPIQPTTPPIQPTTPPIQPTTPPIQLTTPPIQATSHISVDTTTPSISSTSDIASSTSSHEAAEARAFSLSYENESVDTTSFTTAATAEADEDDEEEEEVDVEDFDEIIDERVKSKDEYDLKEKLQEDRDEHVWTPSLAASLWRHMVACLGDVSLINHPATKLSTFSCLAHLRSLFMTLRRDHSIGHSIPSPILVCLPWFFQASMSSEAEARKSKQLSNQLLCQLLLQHPAKLLHGEEDEKVLVRLLWLMHVTLNDQQDLESTKHLIRCARTCLFSFPSFSLLSKDILSAIEKTYQPSNALDDKIATLTLLHNLITTTLPLPSLDSTHLTEPTLTPHSQFKESALQLLWQLTTSEMCCEARELGMKIQVITLMSAMSVEKFNHLISLVFASFKSNADKTMKGGYQILSLLSSLHSTNLECASDHECKEMQIEVLSSLVSLMKEWVAEGVKQHLNDVMWCLIGWVKVMVDAGGDVPGNLLTSVFDVLVKMLRKESNPKNDVTNDVNSPRLNSIDKIDEEKAESFDMASIPSAVMKKTMLFLAKQHTDTSHESASMHTTTASSMSLVDSVSKVVEVGKEEKDTCSSASFVLNHLLNELHHFTPSSFSTSIDETCHFGSSFYCNNDDSETHFANQSNAPTSLSKQPTTQQLNKAKDPLNVSNQAKIVASKDPWGLVVDSPDIMFFRLGSSSVFSSCPITADDNEKRSRLIVRGQVDKAVYDVTPLHLNAGKDQRKLGCTDSCIYKEVFLENHTLTHQSNPPSANQQSLFIQSFFNTNSSFATQKLPFPSQNNDDLLRMTLNYLSLESPECQLHMDDEGDDALDGGDVNYGGDDELIDKIFQQEKLIKNYVENTPLLQPQEPDLTKYSKRHKNLPLFLSHFGFLSWQQRNELDLLSKTPSFMRQIKHLDCQRSREAHKMAVIYVAEGRCDKELILRETPPDNPHFNQFLAALAPLVDLRHHRGSKGGLQAGTQPLYIPYYATSTTEVVFHVTTLMPGSSEDDRLKKMRHIGNDEVHIIWCQDPAPYSPHTIATNFADVIIVIHPHHHTHLATVNIICKHQGLQIGPLWDGCIVPQDTLPLLLRGTAISASNAIKRLQSLYVPHHQCRRGVVMDTCRNFSSPSSFEKFAYHILSSK